MRQVLGLQPRVQRRVEPSGWFGHKPREVLLTGYAWAIDGSDLSEWTRHHRSGFQPVPPTEETIWLAGDIEDAHNRLDHLLGHLPPTSMTEESHC